VYFLTSNPTVDAGLRSYEAAEGHSKVAVPLAVLLYGGGSHGTVNFTTPAATPDVADHPRSDMRVTAVCGRLLCGPVVVL